MSTKSELQARLERQGPIPAESHAPLPSDATEAVGLEAEGWVTETVSVAKILRAAGASLRDALTAINDLAARKATVCRVARDSDFVALAAVLHGHNVRLRRRQAPQDTGVWIAAVRERLGLSQRDFADRLGFDLRTLQNWEQGRNRPDAAVTSLVRMFEHDPELVLRVVYEHMP